jgi:outer membrane biosynthesis protein TonB
MAEEISTGEELNAAQLDAQRAHHLLDRALGLSERGDIAGAIITCRQSLALAPLSPQGWSMLGLLHERDGDIDGAIEAYEKVLQLSPGSVLERESLQRLRQQRGAAPRPAPKFDFGGTGNGKAPAPSVPPEIAPLNEAPAHHSLWSTFYFRSLPLLVTVVACLALILVAQRVAANRQASNISQIAPAPASVEADDNVPEQPAPATTLPPSALAPPAATAPQQEQSEPAVTAQPEQTAPAPVISHKPAAKPHPAAKPKPKPRPAPKAAPPSEMPVLPPPRLTLPKRSAPPAAIPAPDSNVNNSGIDDNTSASGGGPVDVGNSEDSKYIPINPPHFPNPSRNQR